MKKIIKVIFALLFMVLSFIGLGTNLQNTAVALEGVNLDTIRNSTYAYLLDFIEYNSLTRKYIDRRAGTMCENLTAFNIADYLDALGLQPKTHAEDPSILEYQNGLQKFNFYDMYSGDKKTSYNVIYTIKGVSSSKKVVISTNYDNYYEGYILQDDQVIEVGEDFSDGINASASSVAVLLTLAKMLPQSYFDFDIELVFFGAGYNNNAGAKFYNQAMDNTERDKVLLMLDISRIALGDNVYYYSGAFKTKQDNFYANTLSLKKFEHGLHGASMESESSKLGYTNAGYSSSTLVFEGSGINVLHIFAGSYENGIFSGFCEYAGTSNITNTKNDSLDYILSNYNHDLTDNMVLAVDNVIKLLENNNFVNELGSKPSTWQYKVFSAKNYVTLLMLVVLIVLMIIAVIVHYAISKSAYKYIVDNNISGVMLQIDEDESKHTKKKK